MKALQTITVGAGGAASITFSSIPPTYTDLVVAFSGRTSQSGAIVDGLAFQFNSDTGNNYTQTQIYGTGTSAGAGSSTQNFAYCGPIVGASATAGVFASVSIYIPDYMNNSFKSASVDLVTENNAAASDVGFRTNVWNSTSAINAIKLYDYVGGNLVEYSTATLYGVFRGPETRPSIPTIGTATAGNQSASVTFTPSSATNVDASYTVLSSPGSITASGTSSPITVSGLTNGTAYTFQVRANNPGLSTEYSSASNSVTPVAPIIPLLGAWTTAGTSVPSASSSSYYGVSLVSGEPRVFAFESGRSTTSYYNNGAGGTWTTSGAARPVGQGLGSSSKSMTNSGLFYTYGGDTGTQTLVYSTQTGGSWTTQASVPYNAGWSDGCYFKQSGTDYLISAGDYSSGNPSGRAVIDTSSGALTWSVHNNYPVYASAPRFARLTNVPIGMGGFTSPSLSALRANVYSFNVSSNAWTSETALPFTPGGGYVPAASLVGPADSRIYVSNFGTALWSRGDSSGTWRSETATPSSWEVGWGTVTSSGSYRLQLSNGSGNTYFQTVI